MEDIHLFPKPEEEDDEEEEETSDESPKKKLPSLIELLTKEDKAEDKAASDKAKQPADDQAKEEALLTHEDAINVEASEQSIELAPEDEAFIYRSIAEEHLANPVVSETPAPVVNDYLEQVIEGIEPDTAFDSTKATIKVEAEAITEDKISQSELVEAVTQTKAPSHAVPMIAQPQGENSFNSAPNNAPPLKAESKPLVTQMATHIVTNLNLRHSHAPKAVHPNQDLRPLSEQQMKPTIIELENKLIKHEQTLQQLSETAPSIAPASLSNMAQPERSQPSLSESRPNVSKPERAERIGKMLIKNERGALGERQRPSPLNIKPEQIKTLRRAELMDLSANLKVEGASLKHMFENNLFDEAALRRLVEAHLRGQNMLPLLKREILVKQSDFERDLHNRNAVASNVDPLFDKMLSNLEKDQPQTKPPTSAKLPSIESAPSQAPRLQPKPSGMSLANALLGVVIATLIGLILFFVFR